VDPVPDPILLRKSGSAGNRTQISKSALLMVPVLWAGQDESS
jgi:hypothetical protein